MRALEGFQGEDFGELVSPGQIVEMSPNLKIFQNRYCAYILLYIISINRCSDKCHHFSSIMSGLYLQGFNLSAKERCSRGKYSSLKPLKSLVIKELVVKTLGYN